MLVNILNLIFQSASWGGLDSGFWISMGISVLIAILMNIVFWSLKPKNKNK